MRLRTFLKRLDAGKTKLPATVLHWGGHVPAPIRNGLLEHMLNHSLCQPLAEGVFDFLCGHSVLIMVTDAGLGIRLTCHKRRLHILSGHCADTWIAASALDLLRLVAGQIDADSLFFRQQLTIHGNVALGLETKNALDGIDRETLPAPVRYGVVACSRWLTRS